jgi:hypothetical protein
LKLSQALRLCLHSDLFVLPLMSKGWSRWTPIIMKEGVTVYLLTKRSPYNLQIVYDQDKEGKRRTTHVDSSFNFSLSISQQGSIGYGLTSKPWSRWLRHRLMALNAVW